jgi:tungstate transport system substrate-binding protein
MVTRRFACAAALLAFFAAAAAAQTETIRVASTTSTENSGLFKHLLPIFEKSSGIRVQIVAVGTGQAIQIAQRGDADVLLVHHTPSEEKFVAEGHGVKRYDVMYNDFVLIGPKADPAKIAGLKDSAEAFRRIAAAQATFASRGDKSGTHIAELEIWPAAKLDPATFKGRPWYRETGSGMGAALNTAAGLGAYILADRGTWISFKNRQDLVLLVEGDARLANPYGVILVNPARHPHVKAKAGQAFIDWLISAQGQQAIADFKIEGQGLFFPSARR